MCFLNPTVPWSFSPKASACGTNETFNANKLQLTLSQTFGSLVAQPQRAIAIVSLGHSDNGDAIRARSLSSSLAIAST
jgi:hypothetical protein